MKKIIDSLEELIRVDAYKDYFDSKATVDGLKIFADETGVDLKLYIKVLKKYTEDMNLGKFDNPWHESCAEYACFEYHLTKEGSRKNMHIAWFKKLKEETGIDMKNYTWYRREEFNKEEV